jgi:hypothetical protein
MNKCAYCSSTGPLTKEHIWPKALIKKYEALKTYNPKSNKFYIGEAIIKDVCSECNNKNLSPLDDYLSQLYDSFFHKILSPGEAANFEFDYPLLLRALLKISYNSTRASDNEKSKILHAKFANFIVKGGHARKIMLRLQIVTSSRAINLTDQSEHILAPELMRCGIVNYDGPLAHRFCVRMIAINSFWFYLIIPYKDEAEHKWKDLLNGLANWITPTGVLIKTGTNKIHIPAEKTTYMHRDLLGSLLQAHA